MDVDQLFPSKFFRCVDLNGKPRRVTISAIKREDVGGEQKVLITFADESKMLICNKTNARSISKALGSTETRSWIGKTSFLSLRRSTSGARWSMPSASVLRLLSHIRRRWGMSSMTICRQA